jgi:nuclear pore complex protein Nup205
MRFLRSKNRNFFYRQLQQASGLSFSWSADSESAEGGHAHGSTTATALAAAGVGNRNEDDHQVYRLSQLAWLLRSVALELHMNATSDRRSYTQRLMDLLYAHGDSATEDVDMVTSVTTTSQRTKMLDLLDALAFTLPDPPPLIPSSITAAGTFSFPHLPLHSCRAQDRRGLQLYDVQHLHLLLLNEQRVMEREQPLSAAQHRQLEVHAKMVLRAAAQQNRFSRLFEAKRRLFLAWRSVLGVTASHQCFRHLYPAAREGVIHELLEALLSKVCHTVLCSECVWACVCVCVCV